MMMTIIAMTKIATPTCSSNEVLIPKNVLSLLEVVFAAGWAEVSDLTGYFAGAGLEDDADTVLCYLGGALSIDTGITVY